MSRIGFGHGPWHYGFVQVNSGAAAKYQVSSSSYSAPDDTAVTITAQLTDAVGNPVHTAGLVVTWTKSDPGGSFATGTSTTNALGVATVQFTVSGTPGVSCTVTATDTNAMTGTSSAIVTTPRGNYFGDGYFGNGYFGPVYDG